MNSAEPRAMALNAAERARYSRHLLLPEFGEDGQAKLKNARVLLVGAGGLGSPAALYLAAAGVGTIGIIDHDQVDLSNLQRQILFNTADVGASKAKLAQARLLALNSHIAVRAHNEEFNAANAGALLRDYDLLIDGSDRLATRYLVNDACVIHRKPLVSAAIHRFEGQAMTYVPGCGPCYRCLFPETPEDLVPNCAAAGVLGVLPGVMGTLQATEAIKLIAGIGTPLIGRLLTYDALELRFAEFAFSRRADCRVCGERPSITSLQSTAAACATPQIQVPQLTAVELAQRIALARSEGAALALIDVRDPAEFATGHINGSINVPMSALAAHKLAQSETAPAIVYICASGIRSQRACAQAATDGAASLAGGIQAWLAAGFELSA